MLLLCIGLVLAVIFWPVEASANGGDKGLVEMQDDIESTTLIHVGDVAPDFTVEMLNGDKVTLSALRGKPVLLTFWATWCPPCRQELSHLKADVLDVFGDKITVLPISRGENITTVETFMKKMNYTFPVGLDIDQSIYKKYASNYIPRSFVIDGKGEVVYVGVGYDEAIAKEIDAVLKAAINK
jgi:peroxiredoxin